MDERKRFRELGFQVGLLPCGPLNAITDVPGVRVGHSTILQGDGALVPGKGPIRTGVTVILPHDGDLYAENLPAAVHTINGYGKPAGFEQVRELGLLEAPVALTNTLNVGLVLDALVQITLRRHPEIGVQPGAGSLNIVVGETNNSYLNDLQGRHVRLEHVEAALAGASGGAVEEGAVGAGTGTVCFGWKGGIGSASRRLPNELGGYTLGALVQTNFGSPADLVVLGVPVGRLLRPEAATHSTMPGSVMVVLATDAPLDSRQLGRLCVRVSAGLARTGAQFSHGSGDFVIAFSTAERIPRRAAGGSGVFASPRLALIDEDLVVSGLSKAVIESVEEAVLNSLCCAKTLRGRDGHTAFALPLDRLVQALQRR